MRARKYLVLLVTVVIVMVLQSFARRDIVPPFVSDAVITLLGLAVLTVAVAELVGLRLAQALGAPR